jgi:hypothetical protein
MGKSFDGHGTASPHMFMSIPNAAMSPECGHDAWALLRHVRPNVLLIGPDATMDSAIASVAGRSPQCLPDWSRALALAPPDVAPDTIVVRNVAALDLREQHRLHRWLDERVGHVRVIATAAAHMYPLVERAEFLESLYYRLNVVCVEIEPGSASSRT